MQLGKFKFVLPQFANLVAKPKPVNHALELMKKIDGLWGLLKEAGHHEALDLESDLRTKREQLRLMNDDNLTLLRVANVHSSYVHDHKPKKEDKKGFQRKFDKLMEKITIATYKRDYLS